MEGWHTVQRCYLRILQFPSVSLELLFTSCIGVEFLWNIWHRWNRKKKSLTTVVFQNDYKSKRWKTRTGDRGSKPRLDVPHFPSTVAPCACQGVPHVPPTVPVPPLRMSRIQFIVAWDILLLEAAMMIDGHLPPHWKSQPRFQEALTYFLVVIKSRYLMTCLFQTERRSTIGTRKCFPTAGILLEKKCLN